MYRSYSYNNMPQPITHHQENTGEIKKKPHEMQEKPKHRELKKEDKGSFLDNIQADDIILIMVVIALLLDDCDDKLLIAALGFIFLSDLL